VLIPKGANEIYVTVVTGKHLGATLARCLPTRLFRKASENLLI
jgi:hypothetical protein